MISKLMQDCQGLPKLPQNSQFCVSSTGLQPDSYPVVWQRAERADLPNKQNLQYMISHAKFGQVVHRLQNVIFGVNMLTSIQMKMGTDPVPYCCQDDDRCLTSRRLSS